MTIYDHHRGYSRHGTYSRSRLSAAEAVARHSLQVAFSVASLHPLPIPVPVATTAVGVGLGVEAGGREEQELE